MTTLQLIKRLDFDGVELTTDGENIKIKSQKGVITKDILQSIKDNKQEILKHLKEKGQKKNDKVINSEKKEYYPLSSTQRRLYYLFNLNPDSTAYNLPQFFELNDELSIIDIGEILNKIIQRHESLRTYYQLLAEEPVQRIDSDFVLEIEDRSIKHEDFEETKNDLIRPFNLTEAPPVRAGVLFVDNGQRFVWVDIHHIAYDGVSQNILYNEFSKISAKLELAPIEVQYKDYATWQNSTNYALLIEKQRSYWHKRMMGELPITEIPTDFIRNKNIYEEGASATFSLPVDTFLNCFEEVKATLHMKCMAIFNILIWKLTGNKTIITGTPIDSRPQSIPDNVIGMFVNMLPFKVNINEAQGFNQFLLEIKNNFLLDLENSEFPYEEIVKGLNIKREIGRNPLFDIVISTFNRSDYNNDYENIEFGDVIFRENVPVKFDIVFKILEQDNKLIFSLDYSKRLFAKSTIKKLTQYFINITDSISNKKDIKLEEINILSHRQLNEIIGLTKQRQENFNLLPVFQLFIDTALKFPDKVAVVHGSDFVTYKELNITSDTIAKALRRKRVSKGEIVAVLSDKEIDTIATILALFKIGAVYLPIDPDQPLERIKQILDDSNVEIVLTFDKYLGKTSYVDLLGIGTEKVKVLKTPIRESITNLNELPEPKRSLVNYEKYNKYIGLTMVKNSITLQATRGCPYECAYCSKIWPKKHFIRSSENIFSEVQKYYDIGIKRFDFVDDIFNLHKINSTKFFELVLKHNIKAQFFFSSGLRGDVMSKDYIDLMVEAGTVGMALALETASPRLQTMLRKNLQLDKFRDNVDYIASKYPWVILELFSMHGFPTETETEALQTIQFIKDVKWIHFPYFHVLKIFPNTEIEKIAIQNGMDKELIAKSIKLAYHELPETLPFEKSFTLQCQSEILHNYFLDKDRLTNVLGHQMKVMTEDELVQKYNSYLPVSIRNINDLLDFAKLDESQINVNNCVNENEFYVPNLNSKLQGLYTNNTSKDNAVRVLLLDLSQYFSSESNMLYDVVEPPLGLMYLNTYLEKELKESFVGKIAKSRIDFDDFSELKELIDEFRPDIVGIRTLSYFKGFFHKCVSKIKLWHPNLPIISGGPYATAEYKNVLQDKNIELVINSEGEKTMFELLSLFINNNKKLPDLKELKKIKGISIRAKYVKETSGLRDVVLVDEDLKQTVRHDLNSEITTTDENSIAYIIYTSGSTGQPKGSLIKHKSLSNLIQSQIKNYGIQTSDRILQTSSLIFDASLEQIFIGLTTGATIRLIQKSELINIKELTQVILNDSITHINTVPSLLKHVKPTKDLYIKRVALGGEEVQQSLINEWIEYCDVYNVYGPTETTITATSAEYKHGKRIEKGNVIGKPVQNYFTYILGEKHELKPIGATGELYIGGEGVSNGYLNNVELTNEHFMINPFENSLMYKTGDLAKWNHEGDLEFKGRKDRQVKINGHRIELGEIENTILSLEGVIDAIVTYIKNDDYKLIAYYISESELVDLRLKLKGKLSSYMIPESFIRIENIPFKQNGKIDYLKLSQNKNKPLKNKEQPKSLIEKNMLEIWKDVLKSDDLGLHDNFFDIGGDSIKTITLNSRIEEQFNIKTNVSTIFQYPTVALLSNHISTDTINENTLKKETHNNLNKRSKLSQRRRKS